MDEFQQLWPLMADQQRSTDAYIELVSWIQTPNAESESGSISAFTGPTQLSLTGATLEFLKCKLLQFMYPTVQVLRLLPSKLCVDVSWKAILHMTHILKRSPDPDLNMKLVNLLVHTDWPDEHIISIQNHVFPVLNKCRSVDKDYWLCWLSGPKHQILDLFMQYSMKLLEPETYTTEEMFMLAVCREEHFLESLLTGATDDDVDIPDRLKAAILLIQLIGSIDTKLFQPYILSRLDSFGSIFSDEGVNRKIYLDIKRIYYLQSCLHVYMPNLNLTSFVKSFNVIDLISNNLTLDTINHESIAGILEKNKQFNLDISGLNESDIVSPESELYEQFTAIRMLLSVICEYQSATVPIGQCKKSLHNIRTLHGFVSTIQIVLTLIFLRWDHVNHINLDRTIESGSESEMKSFDLTDTKESPIKIRTYEKFGFICNAENLGLILKTLRNAIAKRRNTEEFTKATKIDLAQFESMAEAVSSASWRLSLFRDNANAVFSQEKVLDIKIYMREHRDDSKSKVETSDEYSDSNENVMEASVLPDVVGGAGIARRSSRGKSDRLNATLPRRKPRKKTPFGKNDGTRKLSFSHSTENEQKPFSVQRIINKDDESDGIDPSVWISNRRGVGHGNKCLISKMLGGIEHLMIVCMNRGDLKMTRQLIKTHGLSDSPIIAELDFTESFNQSKEKLRQIFIRYRQQDESPEVRDLIATSPNTFTSRLTVDRIKKVSGRGFEASKIINIIASFSTENHIQLPDFNETTATLKRFSDKHSFLNQYQPGGSIQASIVCDLVLSLAHNHDIALNMLSVLTKLWGSTDTIDSPLSSTIGYFRFLQNLVEAMRLTEQSRGHAVSARSFLAEDVLSTNPKELAIQLIREETLRSLLETLETEYNTIDSLQSFLPKFEMLRRSPNEIVLFQRLVRFVTNANKLIIFGDRIGQSQLSPSDILQLDLQLAVGQMIFVDEVFPNDIEALTCGVNLNLPHVITMNLSTPIELPKCDTDVNEIEQMLDNIHNWNQQEPILTEERKMFECENAIVFDYVSKYNGLLSYLLQKILKSIDGAAERVELAGCEENFIENILCVDAVQSLSGILGKNVWRSVLSFDSINLDSIRQYLVKTKDYKNTLAAIQSIKCQHRNKNRAVTNMLRTWLIQEVLLKKPSNEHNYLLIEHISDINIRAKCLLEHVLVIDDYSTVVRLIRSTLLHKNKKYLTPEYSKQLNVWLQNINIYSDIAKIYNTKSDQQWVWLDVMRICTDTPEVILELLLSIHNFTLCLQWSRIHPIALNGEKITKIIRIFTETVTRLDVLKPDLFQLIETLPESIVLDMYTALITSVHNVPILRYIIYYLEPQESVDRLLVHTINVSLTIIECSDVNPPPWHLLLTPLLIIEQYLMNSRFDALAKILDSARHVLDVKPCSYCLQYRDQFTDVGSLFPIPTIFPDSGYDERSTKLFARNFSQSNEHCLSEDCLDSLLRIYASKALDFRVIQLHNSSNDLLSHSTDQSINSIDSLLNTFIMPREAVIPSNWVRDDEATHCMCCRRAVFTMLTRRHHCRQCGRVVCHACSTQRTLIPVLYADVRVRICDDCERQLKLYKTQIAPSTESTRSQSPCTPGRSITGGSVEWSFSGNSRHNELLRDEFCYEFAPSVSLCLSILAFHSNNGPECANFLLMHCGKFEDLLRPLQPGYPNPEIDYAMVTRMLNCLALAAKVRGGSSDCDVVLEHAEIIRAVVLHRCETLLPMEPLNQSSFRKLRDALVLAEKWKLAIEVSLKRGLSTTGVMAAWGIACLKSGCFETAREKFQLCLSKIGTEDDIFKVFTSLIYESAFQINRSNDFPIVKRPTKSPPLLAEIVHILEITSHTTQPEAMARAKMIRNSNTSLAAASNRSQTSRSDNMLNNEPALNILHTLSNLKNIVAGVHEGVAGSDAHHNPPQSSGFRLPSFKSTHVSDVKRMSPNCRYYEECLFYLTSYGNHRDIIKFLVKHKEIRTALKYVHYQNVETEHFVHSLFMPYLRNGRAADVVQLMIELDESLVIWEPYIIPLCAHLERSGFLNCLYLLQILFKDKVRASMTCVRFYEKNCTTYQDLLAQSIHLTNAEMHLTEELDTCRWEEILVQKGRKTSLSESNQQSQRSLLMKMDSKTLNGYINTITRQLEVTKFLASCEQAGRETVTLLPKMFLQSTLLPTLFGSTTDKMQLAILVLICGTNVTEGFGLAFRIIDDCNLEPETIYMSAAKHLATNQQLQRVEQLIDCIRGNSISASGPETRLCDRILGVALDVFCSTGISLNIDIARRETFERLVKQISDVAIRINCYIAGGQLKSAYLLAVQHDRDTDIRRVWRKADATNQSQIRKLCERKLNIDPVRNNM